MPAPLPSTSPSRVDVRTLSLAQLHRLAGHGSRRAQAELDRRLQTAPVPPPPQTLAATSAPAPARAATPPGARHQPSATPAPLPAPEALPTATPHPPPDRLAEQWRLIAQQDEARQRADGPPRLVGLLLIAWGALLALGGLVMLARAGGPYYLFCGLGAAGVGALLMRCSRWALALHGALLALALAWAWGGAAQHSLALALLQAAPLLVPALWMAIRPLREPLE